MIQGTVHCFANANNDLEFLDLDLKKNQEVLNENRYPIGWCSDNDKETLEFNLELWSCRSSVFSGQRKELPNAVLHRFTFKKAVNLKITME